MLVFVDLCYHSHRRANRCAPRPERSCNGDLARAMRPVEYPAMRAELLDHLGALADRQYQLEAWVRHNFPPDVEFDEFAECVHFFFDDTELGTAPENLIGILLHDKVEVVAIKHLARALDRLFQVHGTGLSDKAYIETAEWPDVVSRAQEALDLMRSRNRQ